MVKTSDAIAEARRLLGTPYDTIDCINLIKKIIRDAPGGRRDYTTAGVNALWDSFDASPKYKDLTARFDGISGAQPGMLAFKADPGDVHHVGIVTDRGTVVHSSSVFGEVVETELTASEGWNRLAVHRYIEADGATDPPTPEPQPGESYRARVVLRSGSLNQRNEPDIYGDVIGRIPNGAIVEVIVPGEWPFVMYAGRGGYVSGEYLERIRDEPDPQPEPQPEPEGTTTTLIGPGGVIVQLIGKWELAID